MPLLAIVSSAAASKQHTSPKQQEVNFNRSTAPATQRIQLAYHTGWDRPILHHSVCGQEWTRRTMEKVTSGGGRWKSVVIEPPAPCSNGAPLAEFVITDGNDHWDKAPEDSNYQIHSPGRYLLQQGAVHAVSAPAVLLVSDLDDTMIGDDEATRAFTRWWQESGVPAGGRLVYNTGRALDLFEGLLGEKGDTMAEPDMLISALGTKIYRKGGAGWEEDPSYTRLLGEGWSLDAVREACYASLAAVGKDAMHFRPPSEMNEFKVTCGVRMDVVERVVGELRERLGGQGVSHRLVVSGSGGWRFMDLVPTQAGKLQALEYARAALGFDPRHTLAAGDSGNDIDMLEGGHLSVVVGNAQPDLKAWAQQRLSQQQGISGKPGDLEGASPGEGEGRGYHSYVSGEGARAGGVLAEGEGEGMVPPSGRVGTLYMAERDRAWGILEALQQFGFKE